MHSFTYRKNENQGNIDKNWIVKKINNVLKL
jgi:hypothetical protein